MKKFFNTDCRRRKHLYTVSFWCCWAIWTAFRFVLSSFVTMMQSVRKLSDACEVLIRRAESRRSAFWQQLIRKQPLRMLTSSWHIFVRENMQCVSWMRKYRWNIMLSDRKPVDLEELLTVLRSIGAMLELVDYMEKYSPQAWMLNYSNPAAIVAEATRKLRPDSRILNICDMPIGIERHMAEILHLDSRKDMDISLLRTEPFRMVDSIRDHAGNRSDACVKGTYQRKGILWEAQMYQHTDDSWTDTFRKARMSMHWIRIPPAEHLPEILLLSGLCSGTYRSCLYPCQSGHGRSWKICIRRNAARSQRHRAVRERICILMSMHPILSIWHVHWHTIRRKNAADCGKQRCCTKLWPDCNGWGALSGGKRWTAGAVHRGIFHSSRRDWWNSRSLWKSWLWKHGRNRAIRSCGRHWRWAAWYQVQKRRKKRFWMIWSRRIRITGRN